MSEAAEQDFLKSDLSEVASLEKPKPAIMSYKKITIGKFDYRIQHPDVETAFLMGIELTRILGEPIAAMAKTGGDKSKALDGLQDAVKVLMAKIDPKQMYSMIKAALKYCEVLKNDSNATNTLLSEDVIKLHFRNKHADMFALGIEALSFQQADFFLTMKQKIQTIMKDAKA